MCVATHSQCTKQRCHTPQCPRNTLSLDKGRHTRVSNISSCSADGKPTHYQSIVGTPMIPSSDVGTPTVTNTMNRQTVQLYIYVYTTLQIQSRTKMYSLRGIWYSLAWKSSRTALPCTRQTNHCVCQHEPSVLRPVDLDHAALGPANRAASAVECCCALAAAAHVPAFHIHHLRGRCQAHHAHPSCRVLAAVWLVSL